MNSETALLIECQKPAGLVIIGLLTPENKLSLVAHLASRRVTEFAHLIFGEIRDSDLNLRPDGKRYAEYEKVKAPNYLLDDRVDPRSVEGLQARKQVVRHEITRRCP
ncbi:MAG: hypothetical protein ACREK6_14720 [Candidatus Rokuibacteriota bacterium]